MTATRNINLLEALKQNPFVLAPMAGITDHAFRTFMKRLGAGVVVTELVSATGLEYKSQKTLDLIAYDEEQRPFGIQLFGEDPETLARAAQFSQENGADFIDLNFGCPVPKVVKKGAGSAMLRDIPALTKVLNSVKSAVSIPVTIKIRTGWDANSRNAHEVCNVAYNEGITWVAIHGRTRAQGYSGDADWEYIADVKSKAKLPVLGNGDIHTPEQAVARMKTSGCDGVLIGRGCLKNPFIFMDSLALWRGQPLAQQNRKYLSVIQNLAECYSTRTSEHLVTLQIKKFAAWFSTGYPGASQFRKSIFQTKTNDEVMQFTVDFFSSIDQLKQEDTSQEPFLMGGHG